MVLVAEHKYVSRIYHMTDGILFQGWDDPYVPRTHEGLLKWKYPEMNSIDFLFEVSTLTSSSCLLVGPFFSYSWSVSLLMYIPHAWLGTCFMSRGSSWTWFLGRIKKWVRPGYWSHSIFLWRPPRLKFGNSLYKLGVTLISVKLFGYITPVL